MPPSSTDEQQAEMDSPTAAQADLDHSLQAGLAGSKRKKMEPRKKPSFKVIGHLVMAMKRFSDSLNPTYTYGKRTTSSGGGGSKVVSEDTEAGSSGEKQLDRPPSKGHGTSPVLTNGHEKYAYSGHGHKFDFLLKPLPPTEEEEAGSRQ